MGANGGRDSAGEQYNRTLLQCQTHNFLLGGNKIFK